MKRFIVIQLVLGLSFGMGELAAQDEPPTIKVQKVAEGVYLYSYNIHNSLFVVANDTVLVTDPQNTDSAQLYLKEIRKITQAPVRYMVYSHRHGDHISGGDQFGSGFVAVNPNSKIPSLIDPDGPNGASYTVIESGAILMYLGLLKSTASDSGPEIVTEIEGISDMVKNADKKLRTIVKGMAQDAIVRSGLVKSLENHFEELTTSELKNKNLLKIQFSREGLNNIKLPEAVAIDLFNIVHQAVANSISHSQAKTITVNLNWRTESLDFSISDNGIGFDMGGTSTDVSLFQGHYERTDSTLIAGVRVSTPMMEIHSIAAGGGSILKYQSSRLQVGPHSAGAFPGPACYRNGGPLTVTDANVYLGRIQKEFFPKTFGKNSEQTIDAEIVNKKFNVLAEEIGKGKTTQLTPHEIANGFLRITIERMANAIKKISTQRGHDITEFTLCCFGGAGGQHACQVADRCRAPGSNGCRPRSLRHFDGP